MKLRLSLAIQAILFVLSFGASLIFSAILPDHVPHRWGFNGEVVSAGSKWVPLLTMPLVILVMMATCLVMPNVKGAAKQITAMGGTFGSLMAFLSASFFAMHGAILAATAGWVKDPSLPIMLIIFGMIFGLSFLMDGVPQNAFFGVRTIWTQKDERVWRETHEEAARLWRLGSFAGFMLLLAGFSPAAMMVLLVVMMLIPVLRWG